MLSQDVMIKEKERIEGLGDQEAWDEAAADFDAKAGDVFRQMVLAMCSKTDVSFWRVFRRMKKRTVSVHGVHRFDGGSYAGALAKCWLWHRYEEKVFGNDDAPAG